MHRESDYPLSAREGGLNKDAQFDSIVDSETVEESKAARCERVFSFLVHEY
jgi:hypothetical protein